MSFSSAPLRVLFVEDRTDDAEMMALMLEDAGYDVLWSRVDTEAGYAAALDPALDVVLADYAVPAFDALRAMALLEERGVEVPFIIVSGTISEEVAVECLKRGAADYLVKDRLHRLPAAVAQALEQRRLRQAHRQAEEALQHSETRFRLAFDSAPIGMCLVAPDGRFLEVNPALCRIVGYPADALLGKTFQDITHPDDLDADLDYVRRMLAAEVETYSTEKRYFHADGHVVWINLSVSLVRDEAGAPRYFISQIEDITGRKADQEAVRKADELKDHFLAVTAHELRTPLTAILGNAELLHREWDRLEPGERRECCATMERQANVLRALVEDLLTLSAIEAGRVELDLCPTEVGTAVAHAVVTCGLRGEVAIRGAAGVRALADPRRLEQILTNYLTNARKHGAGPIGVEVSGADRWVELRVTDRGPGVSAEFAPSLFQKFSQAAQAGGRARGCGLGLAIVRSLAEAQGGVVWYEPIPVGQVPCPQAWPFQSRLRLWVLALFSSHQLLKRS